MLKVNTVMWDCLPITLCMSDLNETPANNLIGINII